MNLRYLSALLRLADILEFDPERTPEIILVHRSIAQESRIYWQRDHEISFHVGTENSLLIFTARTPNAVIHRAVLEVANNVNHELAICATLEEEGAFRVGKVPPSERARYTWDWPAQLTTDIAEKDASFVYIDGAFRPDSKRILDLLSGTALYGNPLAAIRELIQNAVDAVKEQIAYERLQQSDPGKTDFSPTLSLVHRINLSLESDEGGIWLRCVDNGVGTTKDIIENHLLVSGSAPRVSTKTLEREAAERGFDVGRTGQFGVGTLSYFMIADQIDLTTRRSIEAGDFDNSAWRFVTEGLGSLGELTKASRSAHGTEIRLRLKSKAFQEGKNIFIQIAEYVEDNVAFLPCRLELRDNIYGSHSIDLGPGWTSGPDQFGARIIPEHQIREPSLPTPENLHKYNEELEKWKQLRSDALQKLRWFGPKEIGIPELSGRMRVWLPYFELERGNCAVYSVFEGDMLIPLPNGWHYLAAGKYIRTSWRGFSVQSGLPNVNDNVVVQTDLLRGADISVSRERLVFNNDVLTKAISEAAAMLRIDFASQNTESPYNLLTMSTLNLKSDTAGGAACWLDSSTQWRESPLPLVEIMPFSYEAPALGGHATSNGSPVARVLQVSSENRTHSFSSITSGGRLVLTTQNSRYKLLQPGIIWDTPSLSLQWTPRTFPDELNWLVAVYTAGPDILNGTHPYAKNLSHLRYVALSSLDDDCDSETWTVGMP